MNQRLCLVMVLVAVVAAAVLPLSVCGTPGGGGGDDDTDEPIDDDSTELGDDDSAVDELPCDFAPQNQLSVAGADLAHDCDALGLMIGLYELSANAELTSFEFDGLFAAPVGQTFYVRGHGLDGATCYDRLVGEGFFTIPAASAQCRSSVTFDVTTAIDDQVDASCSVTVDTGAYCEGEAVAELCREAYSYLYFVCLIGFVDQSTGKPISFDDMLELCESGDPTYGVDGPVVQCTLGTNHDCPAVNECLAAAFERKHARSEDADPKEHS